jgi:hypothetical protein
MPRGCARRPRPQSGCVSPENPGKSAAAQLIDGVTRQPIDAGEKAPGTASSTLRFPGAPLGQKSNASTGSAAPAKVTTRAFVSETCSAD